MTCAVGKQFQRLIFYLREDTSPTLSNTAGLILDSCKEFNFFSSVKLLKLAFADVFSNSNLRQVCDVM